MYYTEFLTGILFANGTLTNIVGDEKNGNRRVEDVLHEQLNEFDDRNLRESKDATARETNNVAELMMTPRKACREAKV